MRRRFTGTVDYERWIDEKFSMVYMEIQQQGERVAGDSGIIVPKRSTIWHLEDEQRPQQALCGLHLSGVCKSVSPALAMLGTPCKDCTNIIKDWISNAGKSHEEVRVKALVSTDFPFRQKVHEACGAHLFNINGEDIKVKGSPGSADEDPLGLNKKKGRTKKGKKK